ADLPVFPYCRIPELRVVRKAETRRRHTNDDVGHTVETDRCSHDSRIATEIASPRAVRQYHDLGRRSRILAGRERSPDLRARAQRGKELGAHARGIDAQWLGSWTEQVDVLPAFDRRDCREAVGLVAKVDQILRRDHKCPSPRIGPLEIHESARVLEAERL